MRPDDDIPELTPEEQAELDAWEGREGQASEPPEDPRLRRVIERFRNHPDVQAHDALIARVHRDLDREENIPVEVSIPPAFLRLLEHVEKAWAAHEGRPVRPVAAVLDQILNNKLQDLLHTLAVNPTSHPFYRELWNGLCEAEGLAGERIADPTAPEGREEHGEGPF